MPRKKKNQVQNTEIETKENVVQESFEEKNTEETPETLEFTPDKTPEASETTNENVEQTVEVDKSEASKETVEKKSKKKKKKDTEEDEALRDTLALMRGAKQKMTICSGMLECIECNENVAEAGASVCAVTHYNNFKVIIPANHMGCDIDESLPPQEKIKLYKRYLSPMLGANIDFVFLEFDKDNKVALASRSIAMEIKKKRIYLKKSRADQKTQAEYAVEKKIPVAANVMSVAGSTIRLEVFGVETKVFSREADWRYTADLSTLFSPGDKVKVIIKDVNIETELDENEKPINTVSINVSIKEASTNRVAENIKNYKEGSLCVGVISGATEKGYYIALGDHDTGIDAFCTTVHGSTVPQVGDKVACQIVRINTDECFATAKITRIIQSSR